MAGRSKKLIVIETDQEWRHKEAIATVKDLLSDIKRDKNIKSVIVCIEEPGGRIRTYSSPTENRLVLGARLMFMGLSRMGYSQSKE